MKVLFAVNSENISNAIIKKYQKDYREILSYKNVYYFNAIQKAIQQDKTYDRIIISEDLEPFSNNNYESIDKTIFEKLDGISDEAHDFQGNEIPIILICSDRHTKGSSFLVKLFGISVYNALIGNDRSMEEVCRLINKPRTKKQAKMYYKIDTDDVNYRAENENEVSELEIQNIIAHFKKLGKNTSKYAVSFENIVPQYTEEQLKIIINCLPMNVKAVLEETSEKYQEIMSISGNIIQGIKSKEAANKQDKRRTGLKIDIIENKLNQTKMTKPIVIPSSVKTTKSTTGKKVISIHSQPGMIKDTKKVSQIPKNNETKVQTNQTVRKVNKNQAEEIDTNVETKKKNVLKNPKTVKPERRTIEAPNKTIEKKNEDIDVEVVTQAEPVITSKIEAVEPVKKGRGRPRKNDVLVETKPKGKRGRPPKKIIEELEKLENLEDENIDLTSNLVQDEFLDLEMKEVDTKTNERVNFDEEELDDIELPEVEVDFDEFEEFNEFQNSEKENEEDFLTDLETDEDEEDFLTDLETDENEEDFLTDLETDEDEEDFLTDLETDEDEEDFLTDLETDENEEEFLTDLETDENEEDFLTDLETDENEEEFLTDLETDENEEDFLTDLETDENEEDFLTDLETDEDEEDFLTDLETDENEEDFLTDLETDEDEEELLTDFGDKTETKVQRIQPVIDYSMSNLNSLLTKDKKIVTFLGSPKNGVSFLVNSLADLFASMRINTAILDMTKNKNSYYIYTQNEESLRKIAYSSIENLQNGVAQGIKVKQNLTVYTALPNDGKDYSNAESILSTLVQNHSLVLIDCDFETEPAYFANAQEIYLVQSMDILTIQPLTAFLRELKSKGVLEPEKVRVVINKELKVRGLSNKAIIGGMSFYNDPAMSFMTELFNKDIVKYCTMPFDEIVYSKYLESMLNCKISINGYSKNFMSKLKVLGDMVYPLTSRPTSYGNTQSSNYAQNNFSNSMNDTLNKMKKKY